MQKFEFDSYTVVYNPENFSILCKRQPENKNIWIIKIDEGGFINGIVHDDENFYIAIEYDDKSGIFWAIGKEDGITKWTIPGKAYVYEVFDNYLYLIFIDNNDIYYLIKVNSSDGSKVWYHEVDIDLHRYSINRQRVLLEYLDGRVEILSSATGDLIN
ncbi:MAG TPA: hypothetical protein PLA51_07260 [Spirochaetota bacterium]|nr:hypothetical protein [Spirochaetota bacterium]HOK02391.1 hypothetical protein [Spirochaetota bacterium]HOK93511.1 hypothetical protein [Spirochaetota bacterium]HON16261.1 hypothetical protein [Spirochaetota bacterium]HOV09330.1 hypothetical protein [Spirochaetota bacterium]